MEGMAVVCAIQDDQPACGGRTRVSDASVVHAIGGFEESGSGLRMTVGTHLSVLSFVS